MTKQLRSIGLVGLSPLLLTACVLVGVEPDVIGDGDTGGLSAGDGDGDGDPNLGEEGDGDGDDGPGEGTGTEDTGEQDTGDGDGDSSDDAGDGDGDAGDGDGDSSSDGPEELLCEDLADPVLELGDNLVDFGFRGTITPDCGGQPPDTVSLVLAFTAPEAGLFGFTLDDEFDAPVLALVGPICEPLDEEVCAAEGETIELDLEAGEAAYFIVGSNDPNGPILTIAKL